MYLNLDPSRLRPMPGVMVVQIVEVLGGMTKGGIFVPGGTQDHMGKDTCLVRVLAMGGPPTIQYRRSKDGGMEEKRVGGWPEGYRSISEGDVVVVPRDVPFVFVHDEKRYALVFEHEAIVSMPGDEFDQQGFEVVPWRPAPTEGAPEGDLDREFQNDRDLLEG